LADAVLALAVCAAAVPPPLSINITLSTSLTLNFYGCRKWLWFVHLLRFSSFPYQFLLISLGNLTSFFKIYKVFFLYPFSVIKRL
jgi:hypothetical protein